MTDVVSHLRDAGFSDDEISAWSTSKRDTLKSGGFTDEEVDNYLGAPPTPKTVPNAFVDRILKATDFAKTITALPEAVTDIPHEAVKSTIDAVKGVTANLLPKSLGGEREPEKESEVEGLGKTGDALLGIAALPFAPLQGAIRSLLGHPMVATDEALRAGAVQLYGEDKIAQVERARGLTEGGMTYEEAKQKVDTALMAAANRPVMRIGLGAGGVPEVTPVGGLPRGEDFSDAGRVLGNGDTTPAMEQKLGDLYEQKGIHPAEVAHDAQTDPTITQSILSSDKQDMPAAYIQAYHGSPHDFDRFDVTKMYTGEGSDTRGQGIYLAQNQQTADFYRGFKGPDGTLYQVKIKAGEDRFIDWDKPLSEQSPQIKKYASDLGIEGDPAGQNLQDAIANKVILREVEKRGGDLSSITPDEVRPLVTKDMSEAGIAGNKYLDAGSRAAGEGSRNFVVFDDKNIEITHKNGEPVQGNERKEALEDILTERQPNSLGAAGVKPPSYSDAQQQILSKISIDEKAPQAKMTWDKLYTNVIDKLYPIGKAVKEVEPDLPADQNPYQLARLLSGHVGKADHFLNNATFDFHSYEANGPSLKSILDPVKGDLNGFRAYAAAARAIELEDRGVQSGFAEPGPSAPPLVSTGLDAARTVVVDGRDRFEKPFRALIDYQNRVSGYLKDSGVVSDAGYKAMVEANKMYVPFTRVMGIDEAAQAGGGSTLQAKNPIRAIKGSARSIVDPIESVVRNTYHMIEMAEKNVVGTKLVDMLKRASEGLPEAPKAVEAAPVAESGRAGAMAEALGEVGIKKPTDLADALAHASEPVREGEIAILRDGKRETYKVDPDLARAMKGLDAQSMGLLEKVLSYPASTLRAGAVTTPDFALRHTIRDFLYAAATFKGGAFTPMDMARGFSGLIMKDADYWNWLKGGGGNISMVGMDRQYLQADLRKLTGETGLAGRAWNVLTDPNASMWQKAGTAGALPFQAISKFVLDPLRAMTQFAENASHLGAFKKVMRASDRAEPAADNLRQQIIQAAWASRDTAVDAARMGANMRAYNMITAFANIKLQDTDRVVRAIKDDPVSAITKIGAAITVPSVVLWAANHDDPRYAEIPQWQKDMFWLVMTPDHVFRVPKPWAMGMVFGSLPERLLDGFVAHKPDAFKQYFNSLWSTSGPDFVPSAASPIIDQFANRSTFTNRTLIPSAQEKFLPEYQYTPYTTELTKALGRTIGAFPGMDKLKMDNSGFGGTARALTSPILMENYIRGWTGTLGNYALTAADKALRMAGELPDPPQPTSTLADIPVVKAFVVRYPSATTESVQSFYDNYEQNKKFFDTWMAMAQDGNVDAMKHIQTMGGPMMFAQLDGIKETLAEHNQLIRDVYKNPTTPPAEKRQLIDQLYGNMIMVSRYGNDAIRQMREQAADTVSQTH